MHWQFCGQVAFNLRMVVRSPGDDKEINSNLLPAALEGEPLVEVRRRVQQLHHLCLTLNWHAWWWGWWSKWWRWRGNWHECKRNMSDDCLQWSQTFSPAPASLFSTAPGPMFGKLPWTTVIRPPVGFTCMATWCDWKKMIVTQLVRESLVNLIDFIRWCGQLKIPPFNEQAWRWLNSFQISPFCKRPEEQLPGSFLSPDCRWKARVGLQLLQGG